MNRSEIPRNYIFIGRVSRGVRFEKASRALFICKLPTDVGNRASMQRYVPDALKKY